MDAIIEQPFPQSDDFKPHQQHLSPSFSSPDLTLNLDSVDHLPADDDDETLKNILSLELQNLAFNDAVDAKVLNLTYDYDDEATTDNDGELKQVIGQELYRLVLKQAISEAIELKSDDQGHAALDRNGDVIVNEMDHEFGDSVRARVFSEINDVESVKKSEEFDGWNVGEEESGYESVYYVGEDSRTTGFSEDVKSSSVPYPVRPDAEDCSFYMRTGECKYGSNCKFNHPIKRKNQQTFKQTLKQKEGNSDRPVQTECKYYLSSGGCKYGKACKFSHSRGRPAVAPIVEFNFLGLPIRKGEKECPFYMRTGSCKYGSNCRFNHPDPTAVGGGSPVGYGSRGSSSMPGSQQTNMSSWSPRALNEPSPYVPMMYSPPTQGIPPPNSDWNGYKAPVYSTSERGLPTPPAFALNNSASETSLYSHHQQLMLVGEFPERPGQPECSYFLKTGDCKYRSACKFHHPKSRATKTSQSALSDKGLPLRPDQNICSHYSRYGICKYGPSCKYDHPVNYPNPAFAGGSGPDGPRTAGGSGMGRESLIQQPV